MLRLALGLLLCLPLSAHAERAQGIPTLLKAIEARVGQADPAARARVRALLEQAVAELDAGRRRRGQSKRGACVAFAQDIYRQTMLADSAAARAVDLCRAPVFMPAVRYLYATYTQTRLAQPALERAVEHARARDLRGRLPFLKFVVAIFDDTRTQQAALRDGLIFVDAVPRRAEACVRTGYAQGLRTMIALSALERARAECLRADAE